VVITEKLGGGLRATGGPAHRLRRGPDYPGRRGSVLLALGADGGVLATVGALPACGCDPYRGRADKASRANRSYPLATRANKLKVHPALVDDYREAGPRPSHREGWV
jgi:hypothetical protein